MTARPTETALRPPPTLAENARSDAFGAIAFRPRPKGQNTVLAGKLTFSACSGGAIRC